MNGGAVATWWTLLGFSVFIGACVGSFLNVVAGRLPEGRSVATPPSACPHCHHPIRPYDNVPVLSWMVLRAKCRDCSEPISARYPMVELMGAALWGVLFLAAAPSPTALTALEDLLPVLLYGAYFSALLAVSLIDADHFIVPDGISLPLVPIGITVAALLEVADLRGGVGFVDSVFGAVAGAGVMLAIAGVGRIAFGREAMGMGDVKLVAAVGAWQGLHPALLLTIFGGALIGSVVGIASIVLRGRDRAAKLPFGPYLCAGALIAWSEGDRIVNWLLPTL